jgi:lipopolysaccharide export system permease protein
MIGLTRADRLISRQVLGATLLALAVFLGIDALSAFIREIDEIGEGNYTLMMAATYIAYTIPRRVYELFPMAAAIGAAMGLGALAPTSELTALRAAGWSKLRLSLGALVPLALASLVVFGIGESIGPWGERAAQGVVIGAKSRDLVRTNASGIWARDGEDLLNAKRGALVKGEVELVDARLFRFDATGRLLSITRGDKARHEPGGWRFSDVRRFEFAPQAVVSEKLPEWRWDVRLDPALIAMSVVRPRYQSLAELSQHIAYLERNRLDAQPFRSAFWARWFYPLGLLATALLAMPFAFSALRSGGFGKRLFVGLIVAIGFYYLQGAFVNAVELSDGPLPLAYAVPPLLAIVIAFAWLRRSF